jgi:type II secretory pathway pseudopilin PulG
MDGWRRGAVDDFAERAAVLRRPRRRMGATLAELLVALTLSAIVLGTAGSTVLRQQRTARWIGGAAASGAQLRAATGALAAELAPLSTASGDLVSGQVSDTALELRSLIASGVACDDAVGAVTFADDGDGPSEALSSAVPRPGDLLWWSAGDSAGGWRGGRIVSSDSLSASCLLTGAPPHPSRRVLVAPSDTIPYGALLRVTRPARYVFYKSGDGSWQLGLREWVDASARFAPPQPIAGPFIMRAGSARGGFRYFDADDVELPNASGELAVERVARVRISVLAIDRAGGVERDTVRRDSVDVALQRTRGT